MCASHCFANVGPLLDDLFTKVKEVAGLQIDGIWAITF